jgi:putative membrane protein
MSVSVVAAEKKGSESSPPKFSSADETFMMAAAQGGMVEVKLGEIAAKKATKPDIKEFGAMMVTDHSKANSELQAIASKNGGVTLPSKLDAAHQEKVDKISNLSGEQFDKTYVSEMVKDHEKVAGEFEKASKTAQNPELKSFAATTLPVIKNHLKHIKAIASGKTT